MNECPDCEAAETTLHGRAFAHCKGCQIRRIAQGPHFFASAQAGWMTDAYRAVLEETFGEAWLDGHARVWEERDRLDALQAASRSASGQREG